MKYATLSLGALLALSLAFASTSVFAGDRGNGLARPRVQRDCTNCPRPKKYDSEEVVRRRKEVDRSGTVETKRVIPSKRVIETNHLIVHENEIRNVGTVQHNRTIIEKDIVLTKRNIDHRYVNTVVDLVQHEYHTERQHVIEEREIPGQVRYLKGCNCGHPIRAYGSAPRYMRPRY